MRKKSGAKKNFAVAAVAAAVVATVGIGGTFAYFTDQENVQNEFTTGRVDIELSSSNEKPVNIAPGRTIDFKPTITLAQNSNSSYLRVKIEVADDTANGSYAEKLMAVIDGVIEGYQVNGGVWHKGTDGYYYLSKEQAGGTSVSVFPEFTIPVEWPNSFADRKLSISVQAEAIQSEHYSPQTDTTGIVSWNGKNGKITIEKYTMGGPSAVSTTADTTTSTEQ